jgi:hypothetical protein
MFVPDGNKPPFPQKEESIKKPTKPSNEEKPKKSDRLNPFPGWRHAILDEYIADL